MKHVETWIWTIAVALVMAAAVGCKDEVVERAEFEKKHYWDVCLSDNPIGCNDLGRLCLSKYPKVRDEARARTAFAKACDMNNAEGCHKLAEVYEQGFGGPADPAKAKKLFEKACTAGHEESCSRAK